MKKLILLAIFAMVAIGSVNAQGFKAGVNVGVPIGDAGDFYTFELGLDVAYTWSIAENFSAGFATGYQNYFGEDFEGSSGDADVSAELADASFIPIMATGKYVFNGGVFVAADLGYSLNVSDNASEGAFTYMPKVGYDTEMIEFFAFYRSLTKNGSSLDTFGVGAAYKFQM
jgi:hypothetical protein